jgi:predicted nucleic acid-binding protein
MEPGILGLMLDCSVLIAAERRKLTAAQTIESVQNLVGESRVVLSAVTVAEIGHGIYRANTPEIRHRRRAFLDDLKPPPNSPRNTASSFTPSNPAPPTIGRKKSSSP